MAEDSWPSPDHASGAVNDLEYEQLTARDTVSGLIGTPSLTPLIYADSSGRLVKARANRYAKVRGRVWTSGASDVTVTIAANGSGQPRIDLVVLRFDRSTYNVRLAVLTGAPAASPSTPTTTNTVADTGVWELPLARVAVPAGAATLAASAVTPVAWYVADDGGVLCTSATRPAVAVTGPGVKLHETDTGKTYISVGSSWLLWHEEIPRVNLAAAGGFSIHTNGAWVRRRSGMVTLYAFFTRTGAAFSSGGIRLSTIPSGFRPPDLIQVSAYLQGGFPAIAEIATNGAFSLVSYSTTTSTGEYVVIPTVSYSAA